ncbi:MAG: hypothetical protein U0Y68_06295 [Blastocatellia bacterium]
MIEITVLVFLILLLIKPLTQERGESMLKWSLITVVAWVGAEIVAGGVLMGLLYALARVGVRIPPSATLAMLIIYYVLIIAAAAGAAALVVRALRRKPTKSELPTPIPVTE